ncbi:hypothetical protein F2A31_08730 [Acinetobacter suaedae]|uniref:Lipoprotein n=1 Tax=Acinetobacter suaedae TaxID=2609668 RepID=A0A5P1UX84_9GAMM|nr:hypothetical protein [Acinetobacter sp. C16S1]QER39796.1 hypothetical protein F2A31_08730 [Acinetobacter sp. C16S1]
MNKIITLIGLSFILGACTTPVTSTSSNSNNHIATAGSLSCKANEICPNVVVQWDKQKKQQLKLDLSLTSSYDYYDIDQITFIVDGKSFNYIPIGKTQQKYINRLIPKRSSNTFTIPSSFLYEFKNAKNVDLAINTNKGVIKRSVYTPTQQSMLYHNFKQLMTGMAQ